MSEDDERAALTEQILSLDGRLYQAMASGPIMTELLRVELTMQQLKVLLSLGLRESGTATMSELAAALSVSLPTVTGIIDRMVERGLVARDVVPGDRRLVVARLSPGGRDLLRRLRSAGRTRMVETLGRLGLADLRLVSRALEVILTASLDQPSADGAQDADSPGANGQAILAADRSTISTSEHATSDTRAGRG